MLLMIGGKRSQHVTLPVGGNRRIQQAVTGLNKTGRLRQLTQAVTAELARPRESRKTDGAARQVYL